MPAKVESLDLQKRRAMLQLRAKSTDMEKYLFMANLRNTNVSLFYKLIFEELEVFVSSYACIRFPFKTDTQTYFHLILFFFRNLLPSSILPRSVRRVKNTRTSTHFWHHPVFLMACISPKILFRIYPKFCATTVKPCQIRQLSSQKLLSSQTVLAYWVWVILV